MDMYVYMYTCMYVFSSIIIILNMVIYFNLIIITLPYYSDGIHVEQIMHMYQSIKNCILIKITTHVYVYWILLIYATLIFHVGRILFNDDNGHFIRLLLNVLLCKCIDSRPIRYQ